MKGLFREIAHFFGLLLPHLPSRSLLLPTMLLLSASAAGQGLEVEGAFGSMISIDRYIDIPKKPMNSFGAAWIHHTLPSDTSGFAHIYGFPLFKYGLKVVNMNRVRVKDPDYLPSMAPSRLGTSVALYAAMERPFLHFGHRQWSLSYELRNGLGVSNHIWHRQRNPYNELIGSRLTIYFGAGLYAAYHTGAWRFRIGPEYNHFSNGALARPNKGANMWSLNLAVDYHLNQPGKNNPPWGHREPPQGKKADCSPFLNPHFLLDFTYRTGLKTSVGEWLVNRGNHASGHALTYGHYKMYASQSLSAALLYRYDLRYASGIGLDMLYEPYLGRIEVQNDARPRNIQKTSWGLSAHHQVYYKRMAANMSIGWYFSRPFKRYANTDEEYGYYERIGLSYTLPILNDRLRIGYDIHAHRTKAYQSEIILSYQWPLKKKHRP